MDVEKKLAELLAARQAHGMAPTIKITLAAALAQLGPRFMSQLTWDDMIDQPFTEEEVERFNGMDKEEVKRFGALFLGQIEANINEQSQTSTTMDWCRTSSAAFKTWSPRTASWLG